MAGFNYINENNPIAIAETEAQTMINARIDRGYLEYCDYAVDESIYCPNRLVNLPSGRRVALLSDNSDKLLGEGHVKWAAKDADINIPSQWSVPDLVLTEDDLSRWEIKSATVPSGDSVVKFIPQKAGYYFYAVTVYNENTLEESAPVYFQLQTTETTVENGEGITIKMFPVVGYDTADYTFRIYRMIFGSTAEGTGYQLSFEKSGNINASGEIRFDLTPDARLGERCETTKNTHLPFELPMRSITLFDDKLWIGGKDTDTVLNEDYGILYYSKTGDWTQFPAANFFTFPDPVVGITTYDQQLVVQTETSVYYIYGDPDAYSMKMIDYKFDGIVQNSGQALGSYAYFLALQSKTEPDKPKGIFLFNGSTITDISQRICKEFPSITTFKNWVLDNRYFIFELKNEDDDDIRIVYDTVGNGFCMVNKTMNGFRYRTKEFSVLPNGKTHLKKICVRAKGAFICYVVADGKKVLTKCRKTSDKPFDHYFYVKPNRASSFSFVFEGVEGTEIYDWSIVE